MTNLHADRDSLPAYIVSRLLLGIGLLFVLTLLVFTLTPEEFSDLRADPSFDKPLPVQYRIWVGNMLAFPPYLSQFW